MNDDQKLVLDALRRFRKLAYSHRRGGLGKDHKLAQDAIAAFERITSGEPLEQARFLKLGIDKIPFS